MARRKRSIDKSVISQIISDKSDPQNRDLKTTSVSCTFDLVVSTVLNPIASSSCDSLQLHARSPNS